MRLAVIYTMPCYIYIFLCIWTSLFNTGEGQSGRRDRVMLTETYQQTVYTLRYTRFKYTWEQAQTKCRLVGARVAHSPLPQAVMTSLEYTELSLQLNIWLTNDNGQCLTLKEDCKQGSLRSSSLGTPRCEEFELKAQVTDCAKRVSYLVCESNPVAQKPTTTTTTTSTSTTTTTTPTTTTSTTTTVPTTASKKPTPAVIEEVTYLIKPAPKNGTDETSHDLAKKTGTFIMAIASMDKGILGLIIAVVTGTFFISALFICICCMCADKSKSRSESKKYELIHGFSTNTMDRGHRTDTTTDTSLEDGSSDDRSHSVRHDDVYDGVSYPAMFPPPPLLQENTTSASVCDFRPPIDIPLQTRRYNTLGGRMPMDNAVDNNLYASINRHRKQDVCHLGQELPLPPPPPPIEPLGNDDVISTGLSQCTIAGCHSDTGTNSIRSVHSRRSRQSRQSRNSRKTKRARQAPHPKPTTYSPASSRSTRSRMDREQVDLISTPL